MRAEQYKMPALRAFSHEGQQLYTSIAIGIEDCFAMADTANPTISCGFRVIAVELYPPHYSVVDVRRQRFIQTL